MSSFKNIYDVLVQMNKENPDEIALVFKNKRITRRKLLNEVDCLANGLSKRGLKVGEKVAIILSNQIEFICFYFALAKKGLVMVPINWNLSAEAINELVSKQDIKYLIYDKELFDFEILNETVEIICDFFDFPYEDLLSNTNCSFDEESLEIKLENPFVILLTSGTNGNPKQIMHTHQTLLVNAEEVVKQLEFNNKDIFLFSTPLYSMFGVGGTLLAYISGARIVLQQLYSPLSALQIIQEEMVTVHNGNITMFIEELQLIEKNEFKINSLRIGMIGGSVLPESLIRDVESKMGMSLCITYGMTENAGAVTLVTPSIPSPQRYNTVGKPIKNTKIKIVDDNGNTLEAGKWGEILIQTPSLCLGLNDSWFRTQDIGFIDSEQNLNVIGRKKDIITRNNNSFSISLLQSKIYDLSGIKMASCEMVDEDLILWVALKEDYFLNEEVIINYCKENFKDYEIPDSVLIYERFPLTGSGKINRAELKKSYRIMKSEGK